MGPQKDEIEVSVFERGYGEAIVAHVGDGNWVCIDSFLTNDGLPIAAEYLTEIGVDLANHVRAVGFTHWHDDHIRGGAKLVEECKNAVVGIPAVLQRDEFSGFVSQANPFSSPTITSGVDELIAVGRALKNRKNTPFFCSANSILDQVFSAGGGVPYALEALSPSHADIQDFFTNLPTWFDPTNAYRRLPKPLRNDSSIAFWLQVADIAVLLGADLETKSPSTGWDAVVSTSWRDRGKASLVKIAHHGSVTGHHEGVWDHLLEVNPNAVVAPWNRGSKLPTEADVKRILGYAPSAYCTSDLSNNRLPNKAAAVEKTIRDSTIKRRSLKKPHGQVRFRRKLSESIGWEVALIGTGSGALADLYNLAA